MSASDFVLLKGGLTLPVAVVRLALTFEERGITLRVDGDSLLVGPRERLTDADRELIRRWKLHLLALLAYDADATDGVQ
jgi:hypothetical protein